MLALELVRAIVVVLATVLVLIITVILASRWELSGGSFWAIH